MKLIIILMILLAAVALVVIVLLLVDGGQNIKLVEEQREIIADLEEELTRVDFAYTACDMEIDNLEQVIESKDKLILELRVEEQVLTLYKETLEYTLVWVCYAEQRMDLNGIVYAEYIGEQVLEDSYLGEVEEQVEYFEGLE